jgi:hypothetical protein
MPLFLQVFLETATNEQKQGLHDWLYNTPNIQVLVELWEAFDPTFDPTTADSAGEWEEGE